MSYGAYPIIVQWALASGMTSSTVLFLRFGGCTLLLWTICFLKSKGTLQVPLRTAGKLLLVGMLSYALMSALNLAALTRISASLASMLLCLYPVFVAFFYILLGKQKFYWSLCLGLLSCIVGLYLLLDIQSGAFHFYGTILALGASISYASYVVIGSAIREQINPILRATLIMTGAWISYTISGILTQSISFNFHPMGWLWINCIIIVATVIPVMMFWSAVERTGAVNSSIIGSLEPLSTVIWSALFLHEGMDFHQLIGIAFILSGIVAIQVIQFQKQ